MAGSYPRLALSATDWQIISAINYLLSAAEIPGDTAANIASASSDLNATGKYEGKTVWDTDNHRLLRSEGENATDTWWVIDGSASVTPA